MKAVDFQTFAALPAGTIFSYREQFKGEPADFCRGLYRKGETIVYDGKVADFWECAFVPDFYEDGRPVECSDIEGRWGLYDYTMQFVVFEAEDLAALRKLIT